jgi:hypothetical protein
MHYDTSDLPGIYGPAKLRLTQVLNYLTPDQLRALLVGLERGRVDGSWYGGTYDFNPREKTPADFCGCVLGWAAMFKGCSVTELFGQLGVEEAEFDPLERFVDNLEAGSTPTNNPYAAALHHFISAHLANLAVPAGA